MHTKANKHYQHSNENQDAREWPSNRAGIKANKGKCNANSGDHEAAKVFEATGHAITCRLVPNT